MKRVLPWLLILCCGVASAQVLQVYCNAATQTPCNTTTPYLGNSGDAWWLAFGKTNANANYLCGALGICLGNSGLVIGNPSGGAKGAGSINMQSCFVNGVACNSGSGMVYPGAGIPISTGSAWSTSITPGTGVTAALGVNVGSSGAFVVNGGALGTPSSGNGSNITNVNAATLNGATFASPGAIGGTTPGAGSFTTLSASGQITSTVSSGIAPFVVSSTTQVANLNAASVGGFTLPCTIPSLVSGEYLTNNGSTCSWAAVSGGGITLQTNGTNNASQTTLNLVGTGNVAVTNPTGGTVDIGLTSIPASAPVLGTNSSSQFVSATSSTVLSLINSQTCNAQTGTTYTFVLGDANNCVTMSNSAANTVTIPPNSSVAFPIGTTLAVVQAGAGTTTLSPGSGVTLQSSLYGSSTTQTYPLAAKYSCFEIQQTATNTWFVSACDSGSPGYIVRGTKFTIAATGCTPSATSGGATAGTITLASGPCTSIVVTMNGATGLVAPNGWHCNVDDKTALAAGTWIPAWGESASTTTTATIPIPAAAGATDVISFECTGY